MNKITKIIKQATGVMILCVGFVSTVASQTNHQYPEIGLEVPSFSFKSSETLKRRPISSEGLKGRYYILDFWSTGCLACIESFPKMDSLSSKYSDNLDIILVGLEEKRRNVADFYDHYRKKFNLRISSVYDSAVFNAFVPRSVPHLVWVDDRGVVKAITGWKDVTEENIKKFLKNETFLFVDLSYKANVKAKSNFDRKMPLLIRGNGGVDTSYLFRSLISKWDREKGTPYFPPVYAQKIFGKGRYMVIGAPIKVLYSLAFYGAMSDFPEPFLAPEFSNEAIQQLRKAFDTDQRFNYSIELPLELASKKVLMDKMQNDLAMFFQLDAKLVQKATPCYELVVTDSSKFRQLKTATGKQTVFWGAEFTIQKLSYIPVDGVLSLIKSKVLAKNRVIIYNNTGYTGNLTFELVADINDIESIRKGLNNIGMDLVSTTRLRQVIEIDIPKMKNAQNN